MAWTKRHFAAVPGLQLSGQRVGSHSCKKAFLSWSAKFGLGKEARRGLGYHSSPGDKSMSAYSRDFQAAPLRKLRKVEKAVGDGSFHPDATRSGYFKERPKKRLAPFSFVVNKASKKVRCEDKSDTKAKCVRAGALMPNCVASARVPSATSVCRAGTPWSCAIASSSLDKDGCVSESG